MKRIAIPSQTSDIDMTPMLDIVFIMLIFFIVTTSFVKESGMDMSPLTKSTKPSGESKSLVIRISTGEMVSLDGRDVDMSAIAANVQAWRIDNPESTVVLLTDPGASTSSLIKVADGVREAGVFDIKISPMQ